MSRGEYEVQLGFVPAAGKPSHYADCNARAVDGSAWVSNQGVWKHRVVSRPESRPEKRAFSRYEDFNRGQAIGFGLFVFFASIAALAHVMKAAGSPPMWPWLPIVLVVAGAAGVFAYFKMR